MKKKYSIFLLQFCFMYQSMVPCSIVGYIGDQWAKSFVLTGLSRLEYHGYYSAVFGFLDPITQN